MAFPLFENKSSSDELTPEEEAAFKEKLFEGSNLSDAQAQIEYAKRWENLADVFQTVIEPTKIGFEKFRSIVVKDLGLGHIDRSDVEPIMLRLQAIQILITFGATTIAKQEMERIIDRLVTSRSYEGWFTKMLLSTTVKKELTVSKANQQGWVSGGGLK